MSEWTFLSLPVLATQPLSVPPRLTRRVPAVIWIVLGCVAVFVPIRYLDVMHAVQGDPSHYPLSTRRVPEGVATFLDSIGVGGRVLNYPASGGYLQWRLYPRYRIFVDMDVHLFGDELFATAHQAFFHAATLKQLVARYDPSFLSVPIRLGSFPAMMRELPAYLPVFFDDAEVLYLNARHHPLLAKRYGLTHLSPFRLQEQPRLILEQADPSGAREELSRLLQIYDRCALAHHALGLLSLQEGASRDALDHAAAIIEAAPESPYGYWLRADALAGLGAHRDALQAYRDGIRRFHRAWRESRKSFVDFDSGAGLAASLVAS